MRGGQLRFLGSNLDQVAQVQIPGVPAITAIEVIQAGVPSEIRVTVPHDGPIPGKIVLVTKTDQRIETKTDINFIEGIEISSVTAAAMPGDVVEIKGDYLNLIQSLAFADNVIVSEQDFAEHDRYTIKVAVPEEAKTGKLQLYTADLTVVDKNKVEYQIIETEKAVEIGIPAISKIKGRAEAQAQGNIVAKAGEQIVISGSYFNVVANITVGGVAVPEIAMAEDGSALSFNLPAEAPDGEIMLTCKSGVEVPVGTLTSVKPTECVAAPAPVKAGQMLTITGNDMDVVTDIVFADSKGEYTLSNNQNIANTTELYTVTVPEKATEGTLKLAMANGSLIDVAFTLVKPTVTGYNVNPASAGSPMQITGTDLDLITDINFGEAKNDADKFEVSADGTTITVTVPMAAQSGKPKLNLANGTFVEGEELAINEAVFCYFTELPSEDAELKAGDSFTLPVANGDKLTGVEINGEACQYVLTSSNQLIIGIPGNAKKGSKVRLISSNGEITYTIDFIPNTETTTVLWTGLADLKNWSFNWEIGKGTNGDNNANMFKDMDLQEGDVIRVYLTPVDGWWMVKFYDGHWAEHSEAGVAAGIGSTCEISASNYNLDEHGGCIEFTATATMVEQLTTLTDWGICWIMMGQAVISKIAVTHYTSLETTLWEGEAVADNWGAQPNILSDGGTELLAAGMKVGSIIRCYLKLVEGETSWNCQIIDGHWSPNTAFDGCDFNSDNWNLSEHNGAIEFTVTDYIYEHITTSGGWGGSFLLNGDNVICTKVTVE
jgi:hypothetical protein